MKSPSTTFGKTNSLEVGDLVSWSGFFSQHIGLVQKLIERPIGGRNVAYAVVFSLREEKLLEILCINLKKMQFPEFTSSEN